MMQIKSALAKTRTYIYLLFVVEFMSIFSRQINNLTGFPLRRIVYGFVAIAILQIVLLIMYNLKYTGEIAIKAKSTAPIKKGSRKGAKQSKKDTDHYNDMLNCAARIRVFLILQAVMMIVQVLAFQFIGEWMFEFMMIFSEMTCLVMCLMNLTTLQRM